MSEKDKAMRVIDVAGGRLAAELQDAFMEAQTLGNHHSVNTKITLTIGVAPKLANEEFGAIQYEIGVTRGKKKSKALATQINENGFISFDGVMQQGDRRQINIFGEPEEKEDDPVVIQPNVMKFKSAVGE